MCLQNWPTAGDWETGPAGRVGVRPRAREGSVKERGTQVSMGRPAHSFPRLRSPFCGVVPSFDQYNCLGRNTGYGSIKPMTKYCPIFILSLVGVQQDRNSGLASNFGASFCEKSAKWTKFCFFRLLSSAHCNIGPQQSGKSGLQKSKMTKYRSLSVKVYDLNIVFDKCCTV